MLWSQACNLESRQANVWVSLDWLEQQAKYLEHGPLPLHLKGHDPVEVGRGSQVVSSIRYLQSYLRILCNKHWWFSRCGRRLESHDWKAIRDQSRTDSSLLRVTLEETLRLVLLLPWVLTDKGANKLGLPWEMSLSAKGRWSALASCWPLRGLQWIRLGGIKCFG